jgi:hypothetical protein
MKKPLVKTRGLPKLTAYKMSIAGATPKCMQDKSFI